MKQLKLKRTFNRLNKDTDQLSELLNPDVKTQLIEEVKEKTTKFRFILNIFVV